MSKTSHFICFAWQVSYRKQLFFLFRLCLRNLPLTVGEKDLKSSCLKAVGGRKVKIMKVLVMRNKERVDKTGQGRSLGFGFMELDSHENALAVLRATNNNADIFGENRRPIVEFSVENQIALNLQKKRLERQQHKLQAGGGDAGEAGEAGQEESNAVRKQNFGKDKLGWKGKKEREVGDEKKSQSEDAGKNGTPGKIVKPTDAGSSQKKTKKQKKKDKKNAEQQTNKVESVNNNKSTQPKSEASGDQLEDARPSKKAGAKRTFDDEAETGKGPKVKLPKKKVVVDKEEKQFNLLVNKYKEKLFGGEVAEASPRKVGEKRWFE